MAEIDMLYHDRSSSEWSSSMAYNGSMTFPLSHQLLELKFVSIVFFLIEAAGQWSVEQAIFCKCSWKSYEMWSKQPNSLDKTCLSHVIILYISTWSRFQVRFICWGCFDAPPPSIHEAFLDLISEKHDTKWFGDFFIAVTLSKVFHFARIFVFIFINIAPLGRMVE